MSYLTPKTNVVKILSSKSMEFNLRGVNFQMVNKNGTFKLQSYEEAKAVKRNKKADVHKEADVGLTASEKETEEC